MVEPTRLRAAFEDQAAACLALDAPFTAQLIRCCPDAIDDRTAVGQRLLEWPGDPSPWGDVVPLRLAGAFHGLVRRGQLPELASFYPPAPVHEDAALRAALARAMRTRDSDLLPWLDTPPQTNEVGRSGVVWPGLMAIAARTGQPQAIFELGSSGGLNLVPDRLAYCLGGRRVGAAESPITLTPDWRGPPPEGPDPKIVARRGCDLAPRDISDPQTQERLLAYLWPDQPLRLRRMTDAIGLAKEAGIRVERAEAAAWLATVLAAPQAPGTTRVVMHTIAVQYFPRESRAEIDALMAAAGARADAARPLARLGFEMRASAGPPRLTLQLWPGGAVQTLAEAHPHGTWIRWGTVAS